MWVSFFIHGFIPFCLANFIRLNSVWIRYLLSDILFQRRESSARYLSLAKDCEEFVFYSRVPQSNQKLDVRSCEGSTRTREFLRGVFYSESDVRSAITWHIYFISYLRGMTTYDRIQFLSILFLVTVWHFFVFLVSHNCSWT